MDSLRRRNSSVVVVFCLVVVVVAMLASATSTADHHHHHPRTESRSVHPPALFQNHLPALSQGKSFLSAVAAFLPMLMSQRDDDTSSSSIPFNITDLLRMVGVDSNKIGTMVINAIVYVIELISNHFFGTSNSIDGRQFETPGSFILFLFDTKRAENFLKRISDPDVPNTVIKNLQKVTGNDTVCIQQLICKMSPFWWGVNQSVRDLLPLGKKKTKPNLPSIGWSTLLKKYIPSVDEFSANSDLCEARYPGCIVLTYSHQHPLPAAAIMHVDDDDESNNEARKLVD